VRENETTPRIPLLERNNVAPEVATVCDALQQTRGRCLRVTTASTELR